MGSTTPNRAYPFPQFSDAVDGLAGYFEDLADAIDTDVNTIAGRVNTPPICVVKASGTPAVSIPTAGGVVGFDTDVFDLPGWHDPASNNSRVTPNINGWYTIVGDLQFTSATGATNPRRGAGIRLNGSTVYYGTVFPSGVGNLGCIAVVDLPLNGSTDYVELWAFQDSGSTVTLSDYGSTRLSVKLAYRL